MKKNLFVCEQNAQKNNATSWMILATEIMREHYDAKLRKASEVEIRDKKLLSIEEAAELFGIGRGKIRELSDDEDCKFVIWIGSHRKIKRDAFEQFVMQQYSL